MWIFQFPPPPSKLYVCWWYDNAHQALLRWKLVYKNLCTESGLISDEDITPMYLAVPKIHVFRCMKHYSLLYADIVIAQRCWYEVFEHHVRHFQSGSRPHLSLWIMRGHTKHKMSITFLRKRIFVVSIVPQGQSFWACLVYCKKN